MKILWYFAAPSDPFGYGIVTKEICYRMLNAGHHVVVASRYSVGAPHFDGALPVFTGTDAALVKSVAETENFDYVFYVLNENQTNPVPFDNWVAGAVIDYEFVHKDLADGTKKSKFQFCVSEHNKKEFEKWGFKPHYAPWGVDTNIFRPSMEMRKARRQKMGWTEDKFVIGTVGQNLPNDRKNHVNLLRAFSLFSVMHPEAILYMHTSAYSAFPLQKMAVLFGVEDKVFFVDQKVYHMNALLHQGMVDIYNAMDVFCLPTKGESFCLPLIEAQACGVPVITTATTSGPELTKGGWLIPVDIEDYEYLKFDNWNPVVRAGKICAQLENAYKAWKDSTLEVTYGTKARLGAMEYDWDLVFNKHWKPFLKDLEEAKNGKV
jgi:glycosyltransferase involved in cell wall biosynthesis